MYRILFVCLGNICRSPMAEFIFRDLLEQRGMAEQCEVASAAVSSEEDGNPVYPPAAAELKKMGIDCRGKRARRLCYEDGNKYDLLIGMEESNLRGMRTIVGKAAEPKIVKLLSFCGENQDISDPWWHGNFAQTREEILRGCTALLEDLQKRGILYGKHEG